MELQDKWVFAGPSGTTLRTSGLRLLRTFLATYVDLFVHSLPKGYDTGLEDEGSYVSAGEKQRLTIALGLAWSKVLILGEATSSVNTRTEVRMQKAMRALPSDRTSFVIAHRLSIILDADLILVMESGQIVEQGTRTSLPAAGGAQARLYEA